MAYLPEIPETLAPNDDDAPFWAHCNERRLMFQHCPHCATLTHPPLAVCPGCQSGDRAWTEAPARAEVFSYTWIHTAAHEAVTPKLPYNVAVVSFPDLPGVRLVSNVIDATVEQLAVGDAVELVWEPGWQGQLLPRFRLAPCKERSLR